MKEMRNEPVAESTVPPASAFAELKRKASDLEYKDSDDLAILFSSRGPDIVLFSDGTWIAER